MCCAVLRGVAAVLLLALAATSAAEPYLAVRSGHSCGQCHVNPSGGGLRTTFGQLYGQTELPARTLEGTPWTGTLLERLSIGGNARAGAEQTEFDDRDDNLSFDVNRVTLYAGFELNEALTLYVDQQVAPGGSLNREAWLRLRRGNRYLKAGRLFLPFGWRLEDDSAFVRTVSGITMTQGDDGIEIGDQGRWFDWQLAAANGNGGGAEVDDGKLFAWRGAVRNERGRVGFSALDNNTDTVRRRGYGLFAGARTGPVAWLAEVDRIEDDFNAQPDVESTLVLLEANWLLAQGHNLKVTAEGWLPEDGANQEDRLRYSAVYEWFPLPMLQLRLGLRVRDSDEDSAALNSERAFLQLHAYF